MTAPPGRYLGRVKDILRRGGRAVGSPLRRYFTPRFESLQGRLDVALDELATARKEIVRAEYELMVRADRLKDLVSHEIQLSTDTAKVMGSYLADILAATETIGPDRLQRLVKGTPEDLDASIAAVLSYAETSFGFAAQRGLYFNPPVWVGYEPGDVKVQGVNERIAEVPYVFGALGSLETPSRVLDVGAAESLVAFSLASLGHDVTAVDPRPYPLPHPRLHVVVGAVEQLEDVEPFDAVVCLSTVEHIGLPAYGGTSADAAGDRRAMNQVHALSRPGGLLVLTVPFGRPSVSDFQRVYDDDGLAALLEGWQVIDRTVVRRIDAMTWDVTDEPVGDAEATAMVTARHVP